jgi:hypothetical protein
MNIPQSTIAKPLTVIDYIAALEQCIDITQVQRYAEKVPMWVRQDERFPKAVARRLASIKDKRR